MSQRDSEWERANESDQANDDFIAMLASAKETPSAASSSRSRPSDPRAAALQSVRASRVRTGISCYFFGFLLIFFAACYLAVVPTLQPGDLQTLLRTIRGVGFVSLLAEVVIAVGFGLCLTVPRTMQRRDILLGTVLGSLLGLLISGTALWNPLFPFQVGRWLPQIVLLTTHLSFFVFVRWLGEFMGSVEITRQATRVVVFLGLHTVIWLGVFGGPAPMPNLMGRGGAGGFIFMGVGLIVWLVAVLLGFFQTLRLLSTCREVLRTDGLSVSINTDRDAAASHSSSISRSDVLRLAVGSGIVVLAFWGWFFLRRPAPGMFPFPVAAPGGRTAVETPGKATLLESGTPTAAPASIPGRSTTQTPTAPPPAAVVAEAPNQSVKAEAEPMTPPVPSWKGWSKDAPAPALAPFNAEQAKLHQEAWAKHLGVPVEYTNSITMKFRLIPPGEFMMGSTAAEIDALVGTKPLPELQPEMPQHKVIVTEAFYLGIHEVTQKQYLTVIGSNPSYFTRTGGGKAAIGEADTSELPVDTVSWLDAGQFCLKLSEREQLVPFNLTHRGPALPTGNGYRLPTEAQWEFACRAGTQTRYWTGDSDIDARCAGVFTSRATQPVGQLAANAFGLFDVHGNVWEWCLDGWNPDAYQTYRNEVAVDPLTQWIQVPNRVGRGAHFYYGPTNGRSARRGSAPQTLRYLDNGFRAALSVAGVKVALANPVQAEAPPVLETGRRSLTLNGHTKGIMGVALSAERTPSTTTTTTTRPQTSAASSIARGPAAN